MTAGPGAKPSYTHGKRQRAAISRVQGWRRLRAPAVRQRTWWRGGPRAGSARERVGPARSAQMGDCREPPWGVAVGGHCAMGACAAGGEGTDAGWQCACHAGWALFPARDAAPRCTVQPTLQLALCVVSAVCSLATLAATTARLRQGRQDRRSELEDSVGVVLASALILAADALQIADPRRVMTSDGWLTLTRMAGGMVVQDVVVRYGFLRLRAAGLASTSSEAAQTTTRLLERTRAEVVFAGVFGAAVLCVAARAGSTRGTVAALCAYCLVAPLFALAFILRTTSSALTSLCFVDAYGPPEQARRAARSIRKVSALRRITLVVYAFNCTLPLAMLVFLPYTEQWAWFVFDIMSCAAIFAVAANQHVQARIDLAHRRKVMVLATPSILRAASLESNVGSPPGPSHAASGSARLASATVLAAQAVAEGV